MSLQELLARISQISAEIDTQNKVLRQLEDSKRAAERQLNAIRDPVARLPLELSSEIFLRCLPSRPKPGSHMAPMLLTNVCNAWTNIALSTPALWAAIYLDHQGIEILESWLQRAGGHILSIALRESLDEVAAVLRQYSKQLKHLELYEEFEKPDLGSALFDGVETLTIGSPRTITFTFPLNRILGMLRLTPNLVECTILDIAIIPRRNSPQNLILPIRCLKCGVSGLHNNAGGDNIIRHLSLPALEELVVPLYDLSFSDFSLFLKRSLPPLRRLVLGNGKIDIQLAQLDEWLHLVPLLTDLELYAADAASDIDLFSALANSTQLLPNLRWLAMHRVFPEYPPSFFETMLDALLARRPQLACFHFKVQSKNPPESHADVWDGLRQLAADGMDIYIGNSVYNCVSP